MPDSYLERSFHQSDMRDAYLQSSHEIDKFWYWPILAMVIDDPNIVL